MCMGDVRRTTIPLEAVPALSIWSTASLSRLGAVRLGCAQRREREFR
jgi:hypothetical protein